MLRECRRVRPDIWVYAELFTGDQRADLYFVSCLGLNALIREALQTYTPHDLLLQLQQFGGMHAVGALDPRPSLLQLPGAAGAAIAALGVDERGGAAAAAAAAPPSSPPAGAAAAAAAAAATAAAPGTVLLPLPVCICPALFYDCTHDNEPAASKFTPAATLAFAAAAAAVAAACGSTRGTDELVPKTLSVVSERRLYKDYHAEIPIRDPTTAAAAAAGAAAAGAAAGGGRGKHGAAAATAAAAAEPPPPEAAAAAADEGVEVSWREAANNVVIRGEWDGWTKDKELVRGDDGVFRCMLSSECFKVNNKSVNALQFKFIVDGVWKCSRYTPTITDASGNTNNVVALPGKQPPGKP